MAKSVLSVSTNLYQEPSRNELELHEAARAKTAKMVGGDVFLHISARLADEKRLLSDIRQTTGNISEIKNSMGENVMHICASACWRGGLRLLATECTREEMLAMLVARTKNGLRPCDLARESSCQELALLLEIDADWET